MPNFDKDFIRLLFWKYLRTLVDNYYREFRLWGEFWNNPDQNISLKRFKEILAYVYSDEEINPRYIGVPRRLTIINDWLCIFKLYGLARYLPASAKIVPICVTSRIDYKSEKHLYRVCHRFIDEYSTIDRRCYEIYVLIAKKYSWEYEVPDEEDEY